MEGPKLKDNKSSAVIVLVLFTGLAHNSAVGMRLKRQRLSQACAGVFFFVF